jgi:putative oxidoreductase
MHELLLETVPRLVLAIMFLIGVVDGYWFVFTGKNVIHPPMSERISEFERCLKATGFFWPFMKTVDLVGSLCLLFNVAPAFGLALLAPTMAIVVLAQVFLNPKGIPIAVVVALCGALLAYAYADRYAVLFQS